MTYFSRHAQHFSHITIFEDFIAILSRAPQLLFSLTAERHIIHYSRRRLFFFLASLTRPRLLYMLERASAYPHTFSYRTSACALRARAKAAAMSYSHIFLAHDALIFPRALFFIIYFRARIKYTYAFISQRRRLHTLDEILQDILSCRSYAYFILAGKHVISHTSSGAAFSFSRADYRSFRHDATPTPLLSYDIAQAPRSTAWAAHAHKSDGIE